MSFSDPPEAPRQEQEMPDAVERLGTLIAAVLFAALLLFGLEGLRNGELAPPQTLAWSAIAMSSGLAWFSLVVALRSPQPLARLGLVAAPLRTIGWGCAGILCLSHGLDAARAWMVPGGSPAVEMSREAIASAPPDAMPFLLVAIGCVTPLGEELLFRGVALRGLARATSAPVALVASSLLFGAAHGDWLYGALAFALGVGLGLLVLHSGSLLPALAAHALNNLVAVLEAHGQIALPAPLTEPFWGIGMGVGGGLVCLWIALRAPAPRSAPLDDD